MRRLYMSLFVVLGSMAAFAALAWACTPQSYLELSSTIGRSGDQLTVTGKGFFNGPVQVHWNGSNGPVLATAQGPSFTVTVKIPETAPGTYYVHGVARKADGKIVGDATKPFRVRAASAPAPVTNRTAPAPTNGQLAPAAPVTEPRAKARKRSRAGESEARRGDTKRAAGVEVKAKPRVRSGATEQVAARTRSSAAATPAPSRSATPRGKSGQAVFADSLPPPKPDGGGPANRDPGTSNPFAWRPFNPWHVAQSAGTPGAVKAGTGGIGGGFGQRTGSPTETDLAEPGPKLALGAGLLGLGLVVLFGGFAVAEVRRRRVPTGLASRGRPEREPDRFTG